LKKWLIQKQFWVRSHPCPGLIAIINFESLSMKLQSKTVMKDLLYRKEIRNDEKDFNKASLK